MPEQPSNGASHPNEPKGGTPSLAKTIGKITGVIVALAALVGAVQQFTGLFPWLRGVATIEVKPIEQSLLVGATRKLEATVKDSKGNQLFRTVSWSSSSPNIASVTSDGVVKGEAPGEATVTATCKDKSGTALLHVGRVRVSSLFIWPDTVTLKVGDALRFDATPRDPEENPLLDRRVRWASSNEAVVKVDDGGTASGQSPGEAKITAESEGQTARVSVPVIALSPPAPQPEPASQPQPAPQASAKAEPMPGAAPRTSRAPAVVAKIPVKKGTGALGGKAVVGTGPKTTPILATAVTSRFSITNGTKMESCAARLRVLIGGRMIEVSSDPQSVLGLPNGDANYSLGGRVECAGGVVLIASGKGGIEVVNGRTYRCRWTRTGKADVSVSLEPQ
jgi:hypothetical protein